jgi:hypothetical protein
MLVFEARMRDVSSVVANTVALFSFVALMISELAPKYLGEMVFIVFLAAFVMYIKVLESWNPSLWFITLKILRYMIASDAPISGGCAPLLIHALVCLQTHVDSSFSRTVVFTTQHVVPSVADRGLFTWGISA